jgi:hypothetical protein
MKQPTDMGMNRTGIQSSPGDCEPLITAARSARPSSEGDEWTANRLRAPYVMEAEPIGTVPPPGTLKGVAKTGLQKLTGAKPEVLIDKLAERLAFERGGTRLYECLIAKCEGRPEEGTGVPLDRLRHFCEEEAQHFALLWDAIEQLGADPTAQTPCADTTGVAAMGLIQIISDPRTSVPQSLHAIHIAELADHDGWDLLIKLARELGQDDLATQFQRAYQEEQEHLETVREWMAKLTLTEAGVS